MEKEFHTLNEGIPINTKNNENHLGMDTKNNREGLHIWIGHKEQKDSNAEVTFVSQSIHLTRQEAFNLIEEIRKRLF